PPRKEGGHWDRGTTGLHRERPTGASDPILGHVLDPLTVRRCHQIELGDNVSRANRVEKSEPFGPVGRQGRNGLEQEQVGIRHLREDLDSIHAECYRTQEESGLFYSYRISY